MKENNIISKFFSLQIDSHFEQKSQPKEISEYRGIRVSEYFKSIHGMIVMGIVCRKYVLYGNVYFRA